MSFADFLPTVLSVNLDKRHTCDNACTEDEALQYGNTDSGTMELQW